MVKKISYPERKDLEGLQIVTINVPRRHLAIIEKFVNKGIYPSRSEAIRVAIWDWLYKESKWYREFVDPVLETDDINTIRVPNGDGTYKHLIRIGEA